MSKSALIVDTPKNCLVCAFRNINLQNQFMCMANGHKINNANIRDAGCPLVEVEQVYTDEIDDGK